MRRLHGLGEYPGNMCYDAERPSWLAYWLDDFTESRCKHDGHLIPTYKDAYEILQYDNIPRLKGGPVPSAPQTADQMTDPGVWTPDQGISTMAQRWAQKIRAQIARDEADGSYAPSGNLPVTATDVSDAVDKVANAAGDWSQYLLWAAVAAAGLGALILFREVSR